MAKLNPPRKAANGGSDLTDDPYKIAHERDLKVIESTDYLLQVDLDSPPAKERFMDLLVRVVGLYKAHGEQLTATGDLDFDVRRTDSPGGNQHAYVKLNRALSVPSRIALQLFLGSDPLREMFSLARAICSVDVPPLVLFETSKSFDRVRDWLTSTPADEHLYWWTKDD